MVVAPIHQTKHLRQTDNNTNTKSSYEYRTLTEQHELENNGALRISVQQTNSEVLTCAFEGELVNYHASFQSSFLIFFSKQYLSVMS